MLFVLQFPNKGQRLKRKNLEANKSLQRAKGGQAYRGQMTAKILAQITYQVVVLATTGKATINADPKTQNVHLHIAEKQWPAFFTYPDALKRKKMIFFVCSSPFTLY